MTNYSELSDFEINKRVAFELLKSGDIKERYRLSPDDVVDVIKNTWDKNDGDCGVVAVLKYADGGGNPFGGPYDYCNNWSDAGPIITASKINIQFDKYADGIVSATGFVHGQKYEHENPLRAAMIVFLMMKEVEE